MNNEMQIEFTIFKKGVTEFPINILSKIGEPFDKAKKIKFYANAEIKRLEKLQGSK